jgi:hypothetical protein
MVNQTSHILLLSEKELFCHHADPQMDTNEKGLP